MSKKRLGEMLVDSNLIDQEQLLQALRIAVPGFCHNRGAGGVASG